MIIAVDFNGTLCDDYYPAIRPAYLDIPRKWTSEVTVDTRNKLSYYWRSKHYLPNRKLDKYLQDISNNRMY